MNKAKIVITSSNAYFVNVFLFNHIQKLSQNYDVHLIANLDNGELYTGLLECITVHPVNILRKISLLNDFFALFQMIKLHLKIRPVITLSTTPKAGLLSMISSAVCGTQVRIHYFTGVVWQTKSGFYREFLRYIDKFIALLSTALLVDSTGQKCYLSKNRIAPTKKMTVLASGSICGVDCTKYYPDYALKNSYRLDNGIEVDSVVILFMARFTVDKGTLLATDAFHKLSLNTSKPVHFLFVGPDEENLSDAISFKLDGVNAKYTIHGFSNQPEIFFKVADIFCLPSYREGFPMVLLNAAASGIPSIASNIFGSADAIDHGTTGFLFEPGDLQGLIQRLSTLVDSPDLRNSFGIAARNRAMTQFSSAVLTNSLIDFFSSQLSLH